MKFFAIIFLLLCFQSRSQEKNYTQYVNPFIGTGGHGHTFPGATTPFGMVQLSPDTRIDGSWDGCSGYHYSDSVIYGFSHTHLSGTGCSDWGDIMLMPSMEYTIEREKYSSVFFHKNEKANAGYYSVVLEDDTITVELTSAQRTGYHKYAFNKDGSAYVILDLLHRDKLLEGKINILNDSTVEGFRKSEAWAKNQIVYFRINFSRPFIGREVFFESEKNEGISISDQAAIFSFGEIKKGEIILAKVAISSVDADGAKKNLEMEIPHWDFEKVKNDAEESWNKELSKIEVSDSDKNKLINFYTALYHCMIHPSVANDVDDRYLGMDGKIYTSKDFNYYNAFSLWDTFRTLHPLLTIIDKKRTLDFIKTFLEMYKQTGRLPVWELSSNETDCMIGYHCVSVITDAYIKGIKEFDTTLALQAMIDMSNLKNYRGLNEYKKKGFLETEDEHENVSKTLEYAYDDWCIAAFAKAIGNDSIYNEYITRSQSWKNIFNPKTCFMQPRSNGDWLKEFDPRRVDNNFTEGNSWQYSFFVPHDVNGLIEAMGGKNAFEKKLDELFSADCKTTGREQADITGLIGQYAHGNEPSHHMAYLYSYIGKSEKTNTRVKQILDDFYKPTPDGLIGNEDCGQMSAWYVMGSLGIYPVCPGKNEYVKMEKYFEEVKIKGVENVFPAISSESKIENLDFIPSPIISSSSQIFSDSLKVEITSTTRDSILFQVYNGLQDIPDYIYYKKPFIINKTSSVYAYCVNEKKKSKIIEAKFYKRPNNWSVKINSAYNPQYTAGGDEGIMDGLHGDANWRKGRWQGYQGQDFECVIDLKKEKSISKISACFLQDQRSWILMPVKVEYFISSDAKTFSFIGSAENTVPDKNETVQIKNFSSALKNPVKGRFVKVKAVNYGKLPEWHEGKGGDAFLFIDEISIE